MNNAWEWLAFISYKHDDIEWARWLQDKLERYKLPSYLTEDYPDVRRDLKPIFRDETDLGLGYLDENIRSCLQASQYLIVICSRKTPTSSYVCDEVAEFIRQGKQASIIPFVIEGTPEECFPAPLLELEKHPLGANINEISRDYAAVKVIAALLGGVMIDKLWQRHLRAEEKEKERLVAEKKRLQLIQSRFLAEKAADLIEEGDTCKARMLLMEALPVKTDDPSDRPLAKEAEEQLRAAIDRERSCRPNLIHKFKSTVNVLEVSHDGRYAAAGLYTDITSSGIPAIVAIDLVTGKDFNVAASDDGIYHGADVLQFSSDDRYMLGYGFLSDLIIWDTGSQRTRRFNLGSSIDELYSAAWAGDTHKVVIAGCNKENKDFYRILIHDIDEGSWNTYNINHKATVIKVGCSHDGRYIAYSTSDRYLIVMETATGRIAMKVEGPDNIDDFSFNPKDSDSMTAAFVKSNCLIQIKIADRQIEMTSKEHSCHGAFAYTPDGRFLAYEEAGNVNIADLAAKTASPVQLPEKVEIRKIVFSHDSTYMALSTAKGVFCFNSESKAIWKIASLPHESMIGFCGNTRRLVCASGCSGKGMLQCIDLSYSFNLTNSDISYAALSDDGNHLAYFNMDKSLFLVNTCDLRIGLIGRFETGPCFKSRPIAFSRSGKYLASLLIDGSAFVYDITTGKGFRSKRIKEDEFKNRLQIQYGQESALMLFIEDDSRLAFAVDEYICIWDFENDGYIIRKLDTETDNIAYSSIRHTLVAVSTGYDKCTCLEWKISDDSLEQRALSYARTYGNCIITENNPGMSIYSVETGITRNMEVIGNIRSVAVSPDGKYAAMENAFSPDITVVNLDTGEDIILKRYSDSDVTPFVKIHFENSGHVLVSTCDTNTTRWFIDTGEKTVYKGAEQVCVGGNIAVTVMDGTIQMKTDMPVQELIDMTRERFGTRSLTDEEKRTYHLTD